MTGPGTRGEQSRYEYSGEASSSGACHCESLSAADIVAGRRLRAGAQGSAGGSPAD